MTRDSDRLMIDEAKELAKCADNTGILQQFVDTMRENEELRQISNSQLKTIDDQAKRLHEAKDCISRLRTALESYKAMDDGVYQMLAGFGATKNMQDPNSIAGQALSYTESTGGN